MTMSAANSTAPPTLVTLTDLIVPDGNTTLLIVSLSGTMPPADLRRMLDRHFCKNAIKQRRLAARRDAIRELAAHYNFTSGHQLAAAIECDLAEFSDSARVSESAKADALRRVVQLSNGKLPEFETIRKALGGLGKT
jgi:hypothetical protein